MVKTQKNNDILLYFYEIKIITTAARLKSFMCARNISPMLSIFGIQHLTVQELEKAPTAI